MIDFNAVSDLLSDTSSMTVGDLVHAQNFRYRVAPLGAADYHVVTAGGVLLYCLPDGALWLEQFGCAMTGADETARVQKAMDVAHSLGAGLKCGPGSFRTGVVTLNSGALFVDFSAATWRGLTAPLPIAVARFQIVGSPLAKIRKMSFDMDMSNGDTVAVAGAIKNTVFEKWSISGYLNNATSNHYGIRLLAGADNVEIKSGRWVGATNPTMRGIAIQCTGTGAPYGGYFPNGAIVRASVPVTNVRIHNNKFINGSYAWVPNGAEYSKFHNNYCEGQNHRGVQFTAGCYRCTTSENVFKDFASSAVLFCYGSTYCQSVNDVVDAPNALGGEAAFNINTGAIGTRVINGHGVSGTNYFVYVATGARGTAIINCEGEGFYIAGVCLQSDWSDPSHSSQANNLFGRPNYAAASTLDPSFAKWAFTDLSEVLIDGNRMGRGYTGQSCAAYAVVQMRGTSSTICSVTRATLRNNSVHNASNIVYDLAVFRDNGTIGIILNDNDFRPDKLVATSPSGAISFGSVVISATVGSGVEPPASIPTISGVAPSMPPDRERAAHEILQVANTSATSMNSLLGGVNGQMVTLRLDVFTTIVHSTPSIRLKGAVNVSGRSANDFLTLFCASGVWLEINRSW